MDIFNYYGFNYYDLSKELFESLRFELALLMGIMLCLVLIPLFLSFYGMAKRQFEMRYPDDNVVYVVENGIFFTSLVVFLVGWFIGYAVLPFWIIKNIPWSETYCSNFYFALFSAIVAIYFLFERFSIIYVLSNVRIQVVHPLHSERFNLNLKSIEYRDIEQVEYDKFWVWDVIYIKLKNGKYFNGLTCFKNLKYVKTLIEDKIIKEI